MKNKQNNNNNNKQNIIKKCNKLKKIVKEGLYYSKTTYIQEKK